MEKIIANGWSIDETTTQWIVPHQTFNFDRLTAYSVDLHNTHRVLFCRRVACSNGMALRSFCRFTFIHWTIQATQSIPEQLRWMNVTSCISSHLFHFKSSSHIMRVTILNTRVSVYVWMRWPTHPQAWTSTLRICFPFGQGCCRKARVFTHDTSRIHLLYSWGLWATPSVQAWKNS